MSKFIWFEGQWREVIKRIPSPRLHIISDGMRGAMHPATGKMFDSKSEFRKVTQAHGLVECGNDAPSSPRAFQGTSSAKADIAKAYEMVDQGYVPPPCDTEADLTRIWK